MLLMTSQPATSQRIRAAAFASVDNDGATLAAHQCVHLGRHQQVDALALRDAAHAVGALCVVAEHHVLPERQRSDDAGRVLDVHARRVHLIDEGEAAVERDAGLIDAQHAARGAHQHNLSIALIAEDDAPTFTPSGMSPSEDLSIKCVSLRRTPMELRMILSWDKCDAD
jgi:hypothetical protein